MTENNFQYFLAVPNQDEFIPVKKFIYHSLKELGIYPNNFSMQSTLDGLTFEEKNGKSIEFERGPIRDSVIHAIRRADFIVADLTGSNGNILYEIGFAHALKKPVLLMVQSNSGKVPTNISGFLFFIYSKSELNNTDSSDILKDEIQKWVKYQTQYLSLRGDEE
jgi:nucleoside 2-deoxyribosyltransferase